LSFVGEHPLYKWAICFDLKNDPAELINMSDESFKDYMEKSPKVIKNIKLNKSPLLQSYKFIKFVNTYENISEKTLLERDMFIKKNPALKERIISYYEKKALEKENDFNQTDILAEESIYKNFLSNKDSKTMIDFHESNWEQKNIIKNKFIDERLTYFANLLIYEENPEYLDRETLKKIRNSISSRLLSNNKENWLTVYEAYKKIDDLRERCDNNNDVYSLNSLEEINEYLEKTEKILYKYRD
ncbi:exodeoxyribonuclease I, partial [Alphaproteobacteria bacterium]|nr:exodeoxyribonuclease I [Alphaproteobacteria bacterium]